MTTAKGPSTSADKGTGSAPPAAPTPAQLAKAALKHLAEQRLEPTPDNYRKAYEAEGGVVTPPEKPPAAADANANADDGERWSTLISKILRGAERGGGRLHRCG